jgi:trk system potassium uptake protein TrkH
MNFRMTTYILGLLLAFEGAFMAVPVLTAAVYHEPELLLFAVTALLCLAAAYGISIAILAMGIVRRSPGDPQ